eukprot:c5001_g1_i2.p1 GENE.c5001_g1_i2~~c5001_g1_i2.p1  ORF type:complete len:490 (+),score=92.17 c5001_g1_i2:140-1609(+)
MVSETQKSAISFADLFAAVKQKRFRGTSRLFRLPATALTSSSRTQNTLAHVASTPTPINVRRESTEMLDPNTPLHTPSLHTSQPQQAPRTRLQVRLHDMVVISPPLEHKQRYQLLRGMRPGNHAGRKIDKISPSLLHTPSSSNDQDEVKSLAHSIVDSLLFSADLMEDQNNMFTLFSSPQLFKLCLRSIELLKKDKMCVAVSAPAKVFGDIHGQLTDLQELFCAYGAPHDGGDIHVLSYVFLGDFVDRGAMSIEVVLLLFALKVIYPTRVYLVRGNHEEREVQRQYGFYDECVRRFPPGVGETVWEGVNQVFDWLPLSALIADAIFCVHGGVGKCVNSIEQIESIRRPLPNPRSSEVCNDLLWSDPTDSDNMLGVHANVARGANVNSFGPDRVVEFCQNNRVQMIIRAHQCVPDGFEYFAGGKLITVFSATNYCGQHRNDGALVQIDSELVVCIKAVKARSMTVSEGPNWTNVRDVSPLKAPPPPGTKK